MAETKTAGQTSSMIGAGAEQVQDGLAKSMLVPRKMLEANLRAGSALLNFASHRMQAQADFLGRVLRCDNVEQAATMQKEFFENMVGDYSREMSELMEIARENTAVLGGIATGSAKVGKAAM